jgi:transcriptional regulator with XRE-family HTH domain
MNNREKIYGDFLRNLRKKKGLTLRQVEKKTKISNSYLSQIEQGKRGLPSIDTLEKLADAYDQSLIDIIITYVYTAGKLKSNEKVDSDSEAIKDLSKKLNEANRELLKSVILTLIDQQHKTEN